MSGSADKVRVLRIKAKIANENGKDKLSCTNINSDSFTQQIINSVTINATYHLGFTTFYNDLILS